jgi:hypothetical protein
MAGLGLGGGFAKQDISTLLGIGHFYFAATHYTPTFRAEHLLC